ncbi:hypothetical protein MKQ70_14945 [Chitinophaga sedimenti]|uniref:hypothetical protein n=1 Tax=Chitinophaga sedimenti TaxID=2033606 RepID=UPI0020046F19|nr:hypothetical protein [Chitinophaga sedimenti]MCK7556241.1 hypothetical protein [Chitinophaga sedimenti]
MAQTLAASNGAIEMWLNGDFGAARQLIASPDGKYLVNICVDGRYLSADIYTLKRLSGGGASVEASNHTRVDLAPVLPLREWVHVVLQGEQIAGKTMQVYVNGALCLFAPNAPKGSCNWQVDMNGTIEVLPENLALLKHMRMYNRQLRNEEIVANASEICMAIAPVYYDSLAVVNGAPLQLWSRFNTPAGGTVTPSNPTGTEQQNPLVFPGHRMATSYAFTSLGQVVQQKTPDAGESKFWFDKLGRLFASQNAEQFAPTGGGAANRYSFTRYDAQGRIIAVGEKSNVGTHPGANGFVPRSVTTAFALESNGSESQITSTVYDSQYPTFNGTQDNLRKRVAATTYQDVAGGDVLQATYYSYDQIGNVKTLWQQLEGLSSLRKIDYKFDLASGKVNMVRYAPMFNSTAKSIFYKYNYDGENRLIAAETGLNAGNTWDLPVTKQEASYQYYLHGPLARTELGHQKIQGLDYAYTLQGWIKAVNGNVLGADIGGDGNGNSPVLRDAMSYSLDYFTGDYTAIGANAALTHQWQQAGPTGRNLYNGNISRSIVGIKSLNNDLPVGYSYRYDQLNRLTGMRQHPIHSNTWTAGDADSLYGEDVKYDANGNILSYVRRGETGAPIDRLRYNYNLDNGFLSNNRLNYVFDTAGAVYTSGEIRDLGSQTPGITNMIKLGT